MGTVRLCSDLTVCQDHHPVALKVGGPQGEPVLNTNIIFEFSKLYCSLRRTPTSQSTQLQQKKICSHPREITRRSPNALAETRPSEAAFRNDSS